LGAVNGDCGCGAPDVGLGTTAYGDCGGFGGEYCLLAAAAAEAGGDDRAADGIGLN